LFFLKALFEPFGKKPFEIGGVKNFSLSEGEARVRKIQPPVANGPERVMARKKTATGETIERFFE